MNENINLVEILKNVPLGTKLYCTLFGEVVLMEVDSNDNRYPIQTKDENHNARSFTKDGRYYIEQLQSECILLPSKEQRDWSKFCTFKKGDILKDIRCTGLLYMLDYVEYTPTPNVIHYSAIFYDNECMNKRFRVKKDTGVGYIEDAVLASEEERERFFEACYKEGYFYNEEIQEMQKLNDGDVYLLNSGSIGIYNPNSKASTINIIPYYVGYAPGRGIVTKFGDDDFSGFGIFSEIVRVNKPEDKQILSDGLKERNLTWDEEKKELVTLKPKLPKTWEEFCKNNLIKNGGYFIDDTSSTVAIREEMHRNNSCDRNILPNKQTAEAFLSLMQLIQLRDCYRQGWKPNWEYGEQKYTIRIYKYKIDKYLARHYNYILAFQTPEIRDEFLNNFRDLIETAKELI